ncbi:MAG: TIGR01458 family HAD-type hydrolase, partial [Thermomicrobiales bacterium]
MSARSRQRRSPPAARPVEPTGLVAGALLDIDGVLHVGMRPVPGAADALKALTAHGIAFRFLTNTTTASRATLGASLREIGLPVRGEELVTAPVATADYVRGRWPGARCYLIAKGDVDRDFAEAGLTVLPDDAAAADVVVIGGAEERLTYERMNRAYRLLTGGAHLVAMHRNRAWRTADGMWLDSGPYVTLLEEAAGVQAITVGKPSLTFFREALRLLGVPPRRVVMVGDDARNDLLPARRLGLRTVLVRTGKPVVEGDEAHADIVLDSISDLPDAVVRSQ